MKTPVRRLLGLCTSLATVAAVTFLAFRVLSVNTTTAGFAYLLLVLLISTFWGFLEVALASITATVTFNVFFLPPIGKFTIGDPQGGVALFSFLTTAFIASRLSTETKGWVMDALGRSGRLGRYTFSRAIRFVDDTTSFPKEQARKRSEVFELSVVALYERPTEESYAGPSERSATVRAVAMLNERFPDPRGVLFLACDAIMRGDFDAFAILVADNVRLSIRGFPPMDGDWRGRDQVVAAMRRNFARVQAQRSNIDRVIAKDDAIVLHVRESGAFRSDGRAYDFRSVQTFTFANGKIKTIKSVVFA